MTKPSEHAGSKQLIALLGPTGVGKTDFSYQVSALQDTSIINCDVGQLYQPLSLGTAKPPLPHPTIPHFLFDQIQSPENFTIQRYRDLCEKIIKTEEEKRRMPLVVGGSLFYAESLFFKRAQPVTLPNASELIARCKQEETFSWELLHTIDPQRAASIHPHDAYRIERALTLWYSTGELPSKNNLIYEPLADKATLFFLTRNRDDLYERINKRVGQMLDAGWIDEFAVLTPEWKDFIRKKKIIGYTEIDKYLQKSSRSLGSLKSLEEEIAQKTRNYAKRQLTYWSMLKKKLEGKTGISIYEINLTLSSIHLYLDFVPLIQ